MSCTIIIVLFMFNSTYNDGFMGRQVQGRPSEFYEHNNKYI